MKRIGKILTIYVDEELGLWLDEKATCGYKKAPLIRHILRKQMESERRESLDEEYLS